MREKANASVERLSSLSDEIKSAEARITDILVLKKHITNYPKTRDVYVEYRKAGYSKKFFEEHREVITIHKAAKQAFDELGLKKIPHVKDLNEEYYNLMSEKKKKNSEYYETKSSMQELLKAQKNVEMFLAAEEFMILVWFFCLTWCKQYAMTINNRLSHAMNDISAN